MAQHDMNIANATFPATRTDINNALSAIQTTHSGTSAPPNIQAGQIWLDTTSPTTPTLKYYDGADNISLATLDHSSNTVNWLDSTVSITGLSSTATGTVLTLTDSASTSTVNLIIDNQKEIRFRETTANGTNYVALKAPASLTSDLTFTLPSAHGTAGQALITDGSGGVLSFTTLSADGTADWDTTVKTADFTATANKGFFCNTTSDEIEVTLPATPSAGDEIILLDYAGTFDTNKLIIKPNGNKIEGKTVNVQLTGEREGVRLVYIDATQGWLPYSGINEGTDALALTPVIVDFLVIAGGGGGGNSVGGGGGAGGYRELTSQTLSLATNFTVTVGAGGTGATSTVGNARGTSGVNSVFNTITSAGGGAGGCSQVVGVQAGISGGSGGGGSNSGAGGAGNTPTQSPSQGNNGGAGVSTSPAVGAGGGGGASAVGVTGTGSAGGNGGAGTASSITGSSITRAGGGGGGTLATAPAGTGGVGGGGNGGTTNSTATSGSNNTGGGGGGDGANSGSAPFGVAGNGGSGVVIIKYPDAYTISNPLGGLTFSTATAGGFSVTTFTAGTGNIQFN